jgi:hypothetical protein
MPIGKDIYKQMSKKAGERKARIEMLVEKRMRSGGKPVEPPTVEQFKKNIVARTKSNSLHITELAGAGPRNISPNEGMPAINGKSGKEVVAKAVTKVRPKTIEVDPTAGAIRLKETKKNKNATSGKKAPRCCGSCGKPGHTKRTCPQLS